MKLDLQTPGLLFPAISLLLLAFTNRFLALANVIRELDRRRSSISGDLAVREFRKIERQIANLRKRIQMIRSMQLLGVIAFCLCTMSMFALFLNHEWAGRVTFGLSLLTLVASLIQSLREIAHSAGALDILLEDLDGKGVDPPKDS